MQLYKISEVYLAIFIMGAIDWIHHKPVNADSADAKTSSKTERSFRKARESSSSPSPPNNKMKWMDLSMKLPPMEEGMTPTNISQLNFEFIFDDETPASKMTILDPNITWVGEKDHKISIVHEPNESENLTAVFIKQVTSPKVAEIETTSPSGRAGCLCDNLDSLIAELKRSDVILKGDKGERGHPGISIQGQKGEPGEPIQRYKDFQSNGPQIGPPGPRGPPGTCPQSCEFSGSPIPPKGSESPRVLGAAPPESLYKIVPGALVFPTRRAMLQMRQFSFVGTVAFVEADEIFYGRVKGGWRSFTMGSRVHRTILSTPNYQDQEQLAKPSSTITLSRNAAKTIRKTNPEKFQNDSPTIQPKPKSDGVIESNSGLIVDNKQIKQPRLIALNAPMTGNMGGIPQINYQCQRQAMKANLHGIFRAVLTFSTVKALVVVNLKNETVFKANNKTVAKDINIYSFNGRKITFNNGRMGSIWGVKSKVSKSPTIISNCQNWSSHNPMDFGEVYSILDFNHDMTQATTRTDSCEKKHTVLCLEVLHMSQIKVRHRNSNKARLSFEKYLNVLKSYDESLLI